MAKIAVLDQSTINKIAAGEVIERPSSVVKELVENAIDAGASAVTIEIKDGGTSFIRITDNGSGIEKSQIQLAFLRHSTSKIKSVEDLLTISSLGFRGEALSSIAAVAQVELITKTPEALTGTRYLIDGGVEKSIEEIGAPSGTTFIVRNLFYNTPARRKFLKTSATEGGYISELIEKISLSHPEVSFRFISAGQNKLYTSGNGNLKDVIYGVYGREIAANILPVDYECSYFSMTGFVGKPVLNRGNRALENYYINGRYIKSGIITKAIEDAYAGLYMPKKYPFTSIHFKIDSNTIDINVHPTKMELRLSEGEMIYKEIVNAIRQCLLRRSVVPEIVIDDSSKKKVVDNVISTQEQKEKLRLEKQQSGLTQGITQRSETTQKGETIQKDEASNKYVHEGKYAVDVRNEQKNDDTPKQQLISRMPEPFEVNRINKQKSINLSEPQTKESVTNDTKIKEKITKETASDDTTSKDATAQGLRDVSVLREEAGKYDVKPEQMTLFDEEKKFLDKKSVVEHKIIGQLFDTYWLIEFDEKLYIMDQHAAHEKVLYEKFMKRANEGKVVSQQLMPPEIVTLSIASGQVLKDNLEVISNMGFEVESFGGNEYAVYAVPLELYGFSGKDMLLEIIDDFMENPGKHSMENAKERIATMACKAAVKGNNRLSSSEIKQLIDDLLTLENPYNCPHGRPTMISMSKYEIEKRFKRIV